MLGGLSIIPALEGWVGIPRASWQCGRALLLMEGPCLIEWGRRAIEGLYMHVHPAHVCPHTCKHAYAHMKKGGDRGIPPPLRAGTWTQGLVYSGHTFYQWPTYIYNPTRNFKNPPRKRGLWAAIFSITARLLECRLCPLPDFLLQLSKIPNWFLCTATGLRRGGLTQNRQRLDFTH